MRLSDIMIMAIGACMKGIHYKDKGETKQSRRRKV